MRLAIVVLSLALSLTSCGAPTESAEDVNSIFAIEERQLDAKVLNLCQTLKTNESGPSLKDTRLNMFGCREAGLLADNYKRMESFHFTGLDNLGAGDDKDVLTLNTRSQVWLGDSLLGLASLVGGALQKQPKDDDTSVDQEPTSEEENPNLAGLVRPEIKVGEKIIDKETMVFEMEIDLKLTGFVKVAQRFKISGQLIDNALAVTIKSLEKPTFKESLVRSIESVILIVPHAGDVYVDLFVFAEVYRLGLTDKVLVDQFESFLGSGLKTGIDTVLAL